MQVVDKIVTTGIGTQLLNTIQSYAHSLELQVQKVVTGASKRHIFIEPKDFEI